MTVNQNPKGSCVIKCYHTLCDWTTTCTHSPDICELIIDVPGFIFDINGGAGRLKYLHVELMWEGTYEQSFDRICACYLIRHTDLLRVISILQIQHAWKTANKKKHVRDVPQEILKLHYLNITGSCKSKCKCNRRKHVYIWDKNLTENNSL